MYCIQVVMNTLVLIVTAALSCVYQVDPSYTEKTVSFSNYPLSAALACAKLCNAAEEKWSVL